MAAQIWTSHKPGFSEIQYTHWKKLSCMFPALPSEYGIIVAVIRMKYCPNNKTLNILLQEMNGKSHSILKEAVRRLEEQTGTVCSHKCLSPMFENLTKASSLQKTVNSILQRECMKPKCKLYDLGFAYTWMAIIVEWCKYYKWLVFSKKIMISSSLLWSMVMHCVAVYFADQEKGCHYLHIHDELRKKTRYSKLHVKAVLHVLNQLESTSTIIRVGDRTYVSL